MSVLPQRSVVTQRSVWLCVTHWCKDTCLIADPLCTQIHHSGALQFRCAAKSYSLSNTEVQKSPQGERDTWQTAGCSYRPARGREERKNTGPQTWSGVGRRCHYITRRKNSIQEDCEGCLIIRVACTGGNTFSTCIHGSFWCFWSLKVRYVWRTQRHLSLFSLEELLMQTESHQTDFAPVNIW